MSRLAIFTLILSISVITVTADLVMRSYFDEKNGQASVVTEGDEVISGRTAITESKPVPSADTIIEPQPAQSQNSEPQITEPKMEIAAPLSQTVLPPSSTITQFLATQAGFNGTLAEDHFNGKVYQLLDITKYPVEAISLYKIQEEGAPVATITEIALRDEITALQLYVLLQNKTKPYIDLSLNETNAYGDRSFYINHSKKTDEAFLTVKIGKMIYAFAYVKSYHPQIKALINLLIN